MKTDRLRLSVIVPIYNEKEVFQELHARVSKTMAETGHDYEIVFVDDGSKDGSLDLIRQASDRDPHIKYLSFSRNFGHQIALSAGLEHADGDAVIILDADMQDPPELIPAFVKKWQEGWEVVYGVRQKRKEGPLKKAAYFIFYRILSRISQIPIALDAGDFCLMDKKVADIVKNLPEKNRFIRGLRAWAGFRQYGYEYERAGRAQGETKYSLLKLIQLAADGITSLSSFPLTFCGYFGFTIAFLSILGFLWALGRKLFFDSGPPWGWASLMSAVFFLGGVQLIILSIVGSYIARIYKEVQARPVYVIKESGRLGPR